MNWERVEHVLGRPLQRSKPQDSRIPGGPEAELLTHQPRLLNLL